MSTAQAIPPKIQSDLPQVESNAFNGNSFFIPEHIFFSDLTSTEKICYSVLEKYAGNGKLYPPVKQIAKLMRITKRHAQRLFNSLMAKGLLRKEVP